LRQPADRGAVLQVTSRKAVAAHDAKATDSWRARSICAGVHEQNGSAANRWEYGG
jgi:hypothetical protein